MSAWIAWSYRLTRLGPGEFYSTEVWTQYTPGYLYWLWLGGELGLAGDPWVKVPIVLIDILSGYLVWIIGKKTHLAAKAGLLYLLAPAVIFIGAVWGQIDGILAFLMLLTIWLASEASEKKKLALSFAIWALAVVIKPQSFAIFPAMLLIVKNNYPIKATIKSSLIGVVAGLVIAAPFFPGDYLFGLPNLVQEMGNFYSYTSLYAYNVWILVYGAWRQDSALLYEVPLYAWGAILYALSILMILVKFWKAKTPRLYYLVSFLSLTAFYLFPTRVHERYLFPALLFLLAAAASAKNKVYMLGFVLLSSLYMINLYEPYAVFNDNFLKSDYALQFASQTAPAIAFLYIVGFFVFLLVSGNRLKKLSVNILGKLKAQSSKEKFSDVVGTKANKWVLVAILIFSFATRFYSLGSPSAHYFDEVYHAFTAQIIFDGDPKAWEWWNPHPEGFAYEWTHPPLAKLIMVGGLEAFGNNSFGWRAPAALFGTGVVYLVYKLARELFDSEDIALLAAFLISLDGLLLVMSRIGMNDIYFLFFALLSIYFFLRNKNLLSSIAFGLSLASKWSALWVLPLLFLIFMLENRKLKLSHFWFLILPAAIYLASYTPLFLTGHDFKIFKEMQQQMWWYHTGLDATHPFTSPWWSWPILKKPVWLYTSGEQNGGIANIYAMGNPAVFWGGFASIFVSLFYALREKSRKVLFVVLGYLVFFAPWAAAPRIMFLYHYLPSVPFMAISLAYVLKKNSRVAIPFMILSFVVFVYFYPHWTGISVPVWLDKSYYWFDTWR